MALGELCEVHRTYMYHDEFWFELWKCLSVCEAFVGFFWEAEHQVSFMRILRLKEVARATARIALEFAPEFVYVYCMDFVECYLILLGSCACSVSLLLTSLCCDDIHDVTPRVSALAGCDRLVSEPLVIEN
ncbi:hypothetical protein Tco_0757744 [Tanacetum coccineum]